MNLKLNKIRDELSKEIIIKFLKDIQNSFKEYDNLRILSQWNENTIKILNCIFDNYIIRSNMDALEKLGSEFQLEKKLHDLCKTISKVVFNIVNLRLSGETSKRYMCEEYGLTEKCANYILNKIDDNFNNLQLKIINIKIDVLLRRK